MIDAQPARPFAWTLQTWGRSLQSAPLAAVAGHCYTTSDLALRGERAADGWAQLAAAVGVPLGQLVRLKQVHGIAVVVVRRGERASSRHGSAPRNLAPARVVGSPQSPPGSDEGRPHADIVMTDDPARAVAVQVADCVPLLLADPVKRAVAAVHAGWRGTASRVAQVAIQAMESHFGTRAGDVIAAIGPAIGACCYQVRGDVLGVFEKAGFARDELGSWFRADDGHYRLDVPTANRDQLIASGVAARNIGSCSLCTACHPSLFPSYRRDGAGAGRIAGVIRLR